MYKHMHSVGNENVYAYTYLEVVGERGRWWRANVLCSNKERTESNGVDRESGEWGGRC